jgi:hypothetical protein
LHTLTTQSVFAAVYLFDGKCARASDLHLLSAFFHFSLSSSAVEYCWIFFRSKLHKLWVSVEKNILKISFITLPPSRKDIKFAIPVIYIESLWKLISEYWTLCLRANNKIHYIIAPHVVVVVKSWRFRFYWKSII